MTSLNHALQRCAATRAATEGTLRVRGVERPGDYRRIRWRFSPDETVAGGVVGLGIDFHEAEHVELESTGRALANAKRHAALLAAADTICERSLAAPHLIADLAREAVAGFATFCFYDVVENDGRVIRTAAVHRDPDIQRVWDVTPPQLPPWRIVPSAQWRAALDAASVLEVPLTAHRRRFGILTFARSSDVAPFDDDDRSTAEELGRRAAASLDNARLYALARELYERERHIAQTLQNAVLPQRLPAVPAVRFDALYRPGQSQSLVGGDWYDAFQVADGRIMITVGDVIGSGLRAATAMAAVRQSLRGAAAVDADPIVLLEAAEWIATADDDQCFITAWVGLLDPRDLSLHFASAGHPPPLVRRPDGSLEALYAQGAPLGVGSVFGLRRSASTVVLQRGSLLALYTDGLIENRRDAAAGERRLRTVLSRLAPAEATARELCDGVLADAPLRDDVAVLLVAV